MSLLAGSLRGMGAVGTKDQLRSFVLAETEDLVRLTEKASALGGPPVAEVGRIAVDPDPSTSVPEQRQVDFLWHASDLERPLDPGDAD